MIISIYGAGYVGLVSAVCLAKLGHQVICTDINESRITKLNQGECPIYEEQLPELLIEQLNNGRLKFTADISSAIQQAKVHFIATGTPSLEDGSADLSQVLSVATQLACETTCDCLLVTKSTVPVGTGDVIAKHVKQELTRLNKSLCIDVVSNPEFLREGSAVYDFLQGDRIILGGEKRALQPLIEIYQPLVEQGMLLLCISRQSAELTKYAANAMLACKISFINQISRIAEKAGADIDEVRQGMSLDQRIGPHFLQAGIGYGGSCFPKDVRALAQVARALDVDSCLFDAVESINQLQKNWVIEQLNNYFKGELQNCIIGIWGLAFKPGTDDMREASSLVIIAALLQAGAKVRLFDPVSMTDAKRLFAENQSIIWCSSAEDVCQGQVDALVIATEWPEFKQYPLSKLAKLLGCAPVIDGRNCFSLADVDASGIAYYFSVGRPTYSKNKKDVNHAS